MAQCPYMMWTKELQNGHKFLLLCRRTDSCAALAIFLQVAMLLDTTVTSGLKYCQLMHSQLLKTLVWMMRRQSRKLADDSETLFLRLEVESLRLRCSFHSEDGSLRLNHFLDKTACFLLLLSAPKISLLFMLKQGPFSSGQLFDEDRHFALVCLPSSRLLNKLEDKQTTHIINVCVFVYVSRFIVCYLNIDIKMK